MNEPTKPPQNQIQQVDDFVDMEKAEAEFLATLPASSQQAGDFLHSLEKAEKNERLESLIEQVKSNNNCEAICLVIAYAHGYGFEDEIVQTKEGSHFIHSKNDFGQSDYNLKLDIDLRKELQNLRKEQPELRIVLPRDETKGRYATIFIATSNDGDWITCQHPLRNSAIEDNAITRIYHVVFNI